MSRTRTQEQRFLPWAFATHGVELHITELSLDGDDALADLDSTGPHRALDRRAAQLALPGSWDRAELALELRVAESALAGVLPEPERERPPVAVLALLRCDRTYLRRTVGRWSWSEAASQAGSKAAERVFRGSIVLARHELAGHARLEPRVVRAAPSEARTPGYAERLGARLLEGRAWAITIDEPQARGGNHLDIQYRSFRCDPATPAHYRTALYRLELTGEAPLLLLNADHERVRPVLDSKGTTGWRARMRDLLFERIAAGVWSQLILAAATRLADDGELAYAWEHSVLDLWLPRIYPDLLEPQAQRQRLILDLDELPSLLADLDGVLQTHATLGELAGKLADEL